MKKLLIILLLLTLSCEKDEDVKCECTLKVGALDENGNLGYYFVQGVPTDCNGNFDRPSNVPQDHFMIELQNCE